MSPERQEPEIGHALAVGARRGRGDDVVRVAHAAGCRILVLADGAAGVGCGRQAAETFADLAAQRTDPEAALADPGALARLFHEADGAVVGRGIDGDTTGIVCVVRGDGAVVGCSAGDSEAWIVRADGGEEELTRGQARRPRVGSGALPVPFRAPGLRPGDRLIVASDGLWGSLPRAAAFGLARALPGGEVPAALLAAVRARHGAGLPDDFSAIAVWMEHEQCTT